MRTLARTVRDLQPLLNRLKSDLPALRTLAADHLPALTRRRTRPTPATALGAGALGAGALGTLALGALAIGAVAIGAFAIGRLTIRKARVRSLEVDELRVRSLRIDHTIGPTAAADRSAVADSEPSREPVVRAEPVN